MPVLKVDPNTGESLDKAKSAEQAKAEEVQRAKDLAELKERIKNKTPRKKKEKTLPEPVLIKSKGQPPIVIKPGQPIPVKVNPFLAPNGEIIVDDFLEPLNAILKEIEHSLQLITKGYKLDNDGKVLSTKISLPKEFEYKPGVTRVSSGEEAFNLNKPGIVSLKYNDVHKDVYVDRIVLKPLDVRELLKYPEEAKKLLSKLIIDGMWKNLWETKQLDSKKKYFGSTVATLKRPGMGENLCFKSVGADIDFVEIRMFSDITELPKGG